MDFGKLFTSAKITDSMTKISFPVLNWNLKISSWRHINIAFKRKLCSKSYALLTDEESTSSSAHALQSGHSARTENRIYGLSPDSLIGATEDIMQVFLNASTEWQRLFGIVPGGAMLKFHQATMSQYGVLQAMGHLPSFLLSKHSVPSQPLPPSPPPPDPAQHMHNDTVINMLGSLAKQISSLQSQVTEMQKQQQQQFSMWILFMKIISTANKLRLSQFTEYFCCSCTIAQNGVYTITRDCV